MILIEGEKYACAQCIRGHRSSICKHTTRPLLQVRSRGRPITRCNHRVVVDNQEVSKSHECCRSPHSSESEDSSVISLKGCKKQVYNVSSSGSLRILNPVRSSGKKVCKPEQKCPCTRNLAKSEPSILDPIDSVIHKLFSSSAPKVLCTCLEGSCACEKNAKFEGNVESIGEMEMRLIDLPRENGHFQVQPHSLLETCGCSPGNCTCDDCSHNVPNLDMLSTESFLNSLDNYDSCECADEDCNCETCFKHGKFNDIELFR